MTEKPESKLILLSDVATQFNIDVVRDGGFHAVGKIPSHIQNRLVPLNHNKHVNACLNADNISAVICVPELIEKMPDHIAVGSSLSPLESVMQIHEYLCSQNYYTSSFNSEIDKTAFIADSAVIADKNVRIGPRTIVKPNAVIHEGSTIAADCYIGSGVVIGEDAFETTMLNGIHQVITSIGQCFIGDRVTIQANSTVVRPAFLTKTEIGEETTLDCHVHIAHDCIIGKRVVIAAGAVVSGRVSIGNGVFLGPNATISNGVRIQDNATISLGSVVTQDVCDGEQVTGHFAIPHKKWLKFMAKIKKS